MKKKSFFLLAPCIVLLAFAISIVLFFYVFIEKYSDIKYFLVVASIGIEFFFMPLTVFLCAEKSKKSVVIRSVISAFAGLAVMLPLTYLFNNILIIGTSESALIAASVAFVTIAVPFVIHLVRIKAQKPAVKAGTAIIAVASAAAMLISSVQLAFLPLYYSNYSKTVPPPIGLGKYTEKENTAVKEADYYVSTSGSDENDGSFSAPFATIEKARDAVRSLDKAGRNGITVAIMPGEYRVNCLEFTAQDSGTEQCPIMYCNYDGGEVNINGGVTLAPESFKPVTDEAMLARLSDEAKENVICANLTELGLTAEDWGVIHAIGSHCSAGNYDGDWEGDINCELFFNDVRMTMARYPDAEYLETGEVLRNGDVVWKDDRRLEIRNPESDLYKIDRKLSDRIASWKTLDDVWMFGFWSYNWADASTPIESFDKDKCELSPKFVSFFEAKENQPYYFFNIFEELTSPGEWYLDRDSGMVYIYPSAELSSAVIDLSVSVKNIIFVNGADYLSFKGLTCKGTRSDAVSINGSSNTVSDCTIKNIAGWAVRAEGSNNTVTRNEITRTGRGGIYLSGGDIESLTPGNNKADNNLIHDWSEIYLTYQAAVALSGVGNYCTHNEMFNSTHEAITFNGNNNIIAYNLIHDVCLASDDAGAIYAGRRWDCYGNQIKYNCIYNIGDSEHKPDGIYMDDGLSGQIITGNILINIPKKGIHLGGGRDLTVENNILINCNDNAFSYDDRARDDVLNADSWFASTSAKDGVMWQHLYESPWKTALWQEAFPAMTRFSDDFNDTDNPDFVPNPAYSMVTKNLIVNLRANIGNIADSAYRFSTIENNALFKLGKLDDIFTDPDAGDYSLKAESAAYELLPDFEALPISEIGRY